MNNKTIECGHCKLNIRLKLWQLGNVNGELVRLCPNCQNVEVRK